LANNIKCPLSASSRDILMWEFVVPRLPPGTYQIKYDILQTVGTDTFSSCFQFSITIDNTFSGTYRSWYSATLIGKAFFTRSDYTTRTVGDALQVGPLGPLFASDLSDLPYGSLSSLMGSGDLVPTGPFDTTGYVWGITGILEEKIIGATSSQQSHIYYGEFYLGYMQGSSTYNYTNPLLFGTFNLNWTYTDSSTASVSGTAIFSANSTIPPGWGVPLLYGRIGTHKVVTNDKGFLMITGNTEFCPSGVCPSFDNVQSSTPTLTSDKLALVIALPVAFVFVVVLVGAGLIWFVNRRKTEQEDGVFAVARKPEYGAALVVDDIIEETRGNRALRNMLNHQYSETEEDPSIDENDEGEYDYESDDTSRLSRSRSRSLSISRRSRSRSLSGSRSLSRSTSRSVSRTRSISRSSRSKGKYPMRSRYAPDDTDPGESASRATEGEYSE